MAVPYTFATATSAIPLSQLDSNFATTITLGNTAIQLGNTVTTLNNMTLANVTISSGGSFTSNSISTSGNLTFTGTGNRITGDFSNATIANRVSFQNSNSNSGTYTQNLPNGTSNGSGAIFFNNSTPTNAAYAALTADASMVAVQSAITGTGTYLPMTFYTGGSERMRLDTSGNLGIGTTSPAQKFSLQASGNTYLLIEDTLANGYNAATLYKNTDRQFRVGCLGGIGGFTNGALIVYDETAAAYRMVISSTGEVIVGGVTDNGAYNLQCNGTGVWGAGAYVSGSDRRIKEDIAPLTSGLDVVIKLNPVTYRYKEDWSKDQSIQPGFIAQEMLVAMEGQDYVDGVVSQGGAAGYYSVAYQNIIPLLVKAIQEQQQMIETLQTEVAALKGA